MLQEAKKCIALEPNFVKGCVIKAHSHLATRDCEAALMTFEVIV